MKKILLILLCLGGCSPQPGDKCIDGYVYHEVQKDVWTLVNDVGTAISCAGAASAASGK